MNVMYDAIHQRKQVLYTRSHTTGFTIVELLIVIVIIAILAAITIVAYSGIQQRAQNSAIISAAEQTYKLIEGYVSTNDAYPYAQEGDVCVTYSSGCYDGTNTPASPAAFTAALRTIGNIPASIPSDSSGSRGIEFTYHVTQTFNGKIQPGRLTYFLYGTNQPCGLNGTVTYTYPAFTASTTGYTNGNNGNVPGKTICWITIPGPSA